MLRSTSRNTPPPPVMTWGKATPVLVLSLIFDALRVFFEWFWILGPALASVACTQTVSSWVGSLGGLTAVLCTGAATFAGVALAEMTIPFGILMSMFVGFIGWLVIGMWILSTNARIFKQDFKNIIWIIASLGVSEAPLVGSIPAFTITIWRLYHKQIKKDKEALKTYEKQQVKLREQERVARLQESRVEQDAIDEDEYEQEELDEQGVANNDYTQDSKTAA